MTKIINNKSASVRQRLFNLAVNTNRPFEEVLQYYGIERFIYRLAQSRYRDHFILKGALMFTAWGLRVMRSTRDIDLLGKTENTAANLVKIIKEVCQLDYPEVV